MNNQPFHFRSLKVASLLLAILVSNLQLSAQPSPAKPNISEVNINISQELTVPATQYSTTGNRTLILWIPAEFGSAPKKQENIARGLGMRGVDVWHLDLHDAYFVQRNRNSVDQFKAKDISAIMDKAIKQGYTKIILTGSAGAARPILRTARYWQSQHQSLDKTRRLLVLGGLILFHPSLYESRPSAGNDAQYIPETYATNIPVYIIQPTYSTAIYRVSTLLKAIRTGGSQVWIHFLQDIKDGFQFNIERHQRPIDLKVRARLPGYMVSAIKRMTLKPGPQVLAKMLTPGKKSKDTFPGLKPYKSRSTPSLTLKDINDKTISIKRFRGKVLLVSFWASWCPPCIREMPSINRLAQHFKHKNFRVVSVNIGESKADITKFLSKHALLGEILMDPGLSAYKKWKIYVIPSNFIIDKNGNMRYSSVGAVDWDTKPIRSTINKLIVE